MECGGGDERKQNPERHVDLALDFRKFVLKSGKEAALTLRAALDTVNANRSGPMVLSPKVAGCEPRTAG